MKIRSADWWLLRKANTAGGERLRSAEGSISRAGDGATVWLGAAGVLAATGQRGRKAALHGLASLALTPVRLRLDFSLSPHSPSRLPDRGRPVAVTFPETS